MSVHNAVNNSQSYANVALYLSLIVIFAWFGGMKFTGYEAEAIKGLVSNSPFIAWTYNAFSVRAVSGLIGAVELSVAALLAARVISPKLSAIGALGASFTFVLTSSFLFSTPGVVEAGLGFPGISVLPGQFLLKDLGLLAAALALLAESVSAMRAKRRSI